VRRIWILLLALALAALPAAAVEVQLRDGTVLEASTYTVTGSYVMLTLSDGRQVAYDVADVNLEALKKAEAAAAAKQPAEGEEVDADTLSAGNRKLVIPPEAPATTGIAITDADVKHVRDQAPAAEGEGEEQTTPGGPPPGYSSGGRVVLNNLQVTSQGGDSWLVEGEVVNRSPQPVINVKVQLQTSPPPGQTPWSGEVDVAQQLMPGEKGVFSQSFTAAKPEDKVHPDVRASVIWMQRQNEGQEQPTAQSPATAGGVPSKGYE